MSKSSPSPPPAPDPAATASAQSGSNITTAIANAQLNRVNQTTPWGSITYTQGTPGANGVPTWSSQIQLSPQQQQLLDQQQGMQLQRNQIAQGYLGQVGRPLDLSGLHPIDIRGQQYTGAVNAPGQAAPLPQSTPQAPPAANNSNSDLIAQILAMLGGTGMGNTPGNTSGNTAPTTAPPASTPSSRGMNINAGAAGNPLDQLLAQDHGSLWGTSGGMNYQYGRDSTGRDTFGPGTDEAGNPLGNQDKSMIGSQDERHAALSQALSQYGPGWTQIRNTNIGGPGGVIDPSKVKYDPVAGLVTPVQNLNPTYDDTARRIAIVLAPAAIGMAAGAMSGAGLGASYGDSAAAFGGAGAGAGTAGAGTAAPAGAESAGTGAFDVGGSNGFGGSTALSGAEAGAPVTDLSVNASQPGIFQQAGNNFMSGRGLLGLSGGQRAGIALLPALLRALSARNAQGGGH